MKKLVFLMGASLALAACSTGGEDTAATAEGEAASAAGAATAPAGLAAMPTEALSGDAATAVMKDRHEWFEEMGDSFKALNRQSRSDSPDMAAVMEAAALIASKSAELPSRFAPGTGPDAGKTEARANIWESPDDFMAKAHGLHTAAIALNDVATAGDVAGFKEAFGKTGAACKACHDTYREED